MVVMDHGREMLVAALEVKWHCSAGGEGKVVSR